MYEVSPGTLLVGPGSTGEEGFKLFEIPPEELSTARLLSGNPAPDFDMFSHGAGRHDLAGGRLFGKLAVPRQRCAKPLSDSAAPLCARQTDLDHRDGPDCVRRRPVVCFVSRYFPVSGPTGPLCKKTMCRLSFTTNLSRTNSAELRLSGTALHYALIAQELIGNTVELNGQPLALTEADQLLTL